MLHSFSYAFIGWGVPACLLDDQEPLNKVESSGLDIDGQDLFNRVARVGCKGAKGGQLLWCDCER